MIYLIELEKIFARFNNKYTNLLSSLLLSTANQFLLVLSTNYVIYIEIQYQKNLVYVSWCSRCTYIICKDGSVPSEWNVLKSEKKIFVTWRNKIFEDILEWALEHAKCPTCSLFWSRLFIISKMTGNKLYNDRKRSYMIQRSYTYFLIWLD